MEEPVELLFCSRKEPGVGVLVDPDSRSGVVGFLVRHDSCFVIRLVDGIQNSFHCLIHHLVSFDRCCFAGLWGVVLQEGVMPWYGDRHKGFMFTLSSWWGGWLVGFIGVSCGVGGWVGGSLWHVVWWWNLLLRLLE